MKRLLVRPPKLTLTSSFTEAYRVGRFTQLELISHSELIREASKHDLTVRQETLEELDRYGAFTPIAFVGADWHGDFYGPRWNLDAMTFRDEAGFQRWSRYRFREEGFRRVIALYSPWQLMYLKSALEDRLVLFTLPYVLGRRDRLLRGLKNARPFWRVERDFWESLEENWRPVVLLLSWVQNRYLPFVRGRSTTVYVEGQRESVDPVRDEVRTFDAAALIRRLGISIDDVRRTYDQLALAGETFGVHVFVEGPSDQELIGGLMDAIWGDHRRLGVRFTPLGGLGEVARQATLFEMFSTYARKALLVSATTVTTSSASSSARNYRPSPTTRARSSAT